MRGRRDSCEGGEREVRGRRDQVCESSQRMSTNVFSSSSSSCPPPSSFSL